MKILALETSTHACSTALLEGNLRNFSCIERFEIAPRQHTQMILPMVDSVLDEAGYDIKQVDVLAFGRGPGAFTGVRVATGVVQAISYGADLPVAQISSLAAIAQACYRQEKKEKVLVANDARMDEVYFGAYELNEGFMTLVSQEQVIKPEKLSNYLQKASNSIVLDRNWYAVGTGWSVYEKQLQKVLIDAQLEHSIDETLEFPRAKDIGYLAFSEASQGKLISSEQVSPVYLRDDVAKKPQQSVSMV